MMTLNQFNASVGTARWAIAFSSIDGTLAMAGQGRRTLCRHTNLLQDVRLELEPGLAMKLGLVQALKKNRIDDI